MLYFLIAFVIIIYVAHFLIQNTKAAKIFNKIPGPKLLPLLGNGIDFLTGPVHLFYRGRLLANQSKTIARLWGAHERILNIYDADDIEVVLSNVKYSTKGNVYSFLHPWLKQGLLTSNGEKWQNRRKILTPTFHFNILRQYCVTFVEQSEKIVEKLKLEVGKKETDILPLLTDFTLQSICETAMGTNLETADQNTVQKYKDAIYDLGVLLVHRFTSMWLHPPAIYYLTPTYRKQQEVVSILHKFTSDVIDDRRRTFHLSKKDLQIDEVKDGYDYQPKKRLAMLDLLLSAEAEGKIDAEGIREEVDTFMFEGHDTNTMAMMFGLMELANHPEIQDKISAELDEIFGDSNDPVTIEDLNKMRYLERCIKEILRLYPSVPFMNRQILEDMQLKDYLVPAGTLCNIHMYDLHRNAKYFPDPDKFDPDRHLPENCVKRHPFAYIPFSAGPRNCIGQKFAILEDKALLSAIIRNFKLEAVTRPQDIVFSADLILRCQTRVKVRFVPRIK